MDQFKSALFAGELDPPPFYVGETRNDPSNWLHLEIEIPRCTLPPSQAALQVRPKQLYGVNRETIASVLLTTDALPGDNTRWWPLFDHSASDYKPDNAFSALAAIPFRDFPERGRRELESLLVPKAKLAAWFGERGQPVPAAGHMSNVRRSGNGRGPCLPACAPVAPRASRLAEEASRIRGMAPGDRRVQRERATVSLDHPAEHGRNLERWVPVE